MSNKNLALANGSTLSAKYPKGVRWDIDIPRIDLAHAIDEAVVKNADRPCIDFLGKKMNYREFGQLITNAAKGLQDMGVKKGDRVGLFMPNTPYYPIMFFAALKIGAVVVNYSPLYTKEELRKQIRDSGTNVMVTLDLKEVEDRGRTVELLQEGELKNIVRCPLSGMLPTTKSVLYRLLKGSQIAAEPEPDEKRVVFFKDLIKNDGLYKSQAIEADDDAVYQYTGGTTGIPKGAVLTHFNLMSNCCMVSEFFGANPGRDLGDSKGLMVEGKARVMAAIPYFHVFGMMTSMISSLRMGAEVIIIPNPKDMKQAMKSVTKGRIDLFPAVPRLLQAISEHPDAKKYDFTNIQSVISGGAPLPPGTKAAFEEAARNPGMIKQGYGLSETSPVVTTTPPGGANKIESVGMPFPRTQIKISDPEDPDKILNIGEIGEICIKGPQVMKGYHNRPDETDAVITKDGWLRTGDLGYMDEDYYIFIVDRLKRMIIVNGFKVFPNEVEKAISAHPAVAECVVVAVPDKSAGEAGKAFIRFRPDAAQTPSESDLRKFLEDTCHLNRIKMPKHIAFVTEELPKTSVGKPDWKKLQDEEKAKFAQADKGPDSSPKPQA